MRMEIVRAENGYVVLLEADPGSFGKRFIAEDFAKVGEIVVSQLAAAELDRQGRNATADKYGAVGGTPADIQKPLWDQGAYPFQARVAQATAEQLDKQLRGAIIGALGPSVGDQYA